MTEEEATALGKRLVACKHFRPMRGMLDMQGRTWDASLLWRWSNDVDVPDLRDPATLGCVLALVRAVHGAGVCTFRRMDSPCWYVRTVLWSNYDGDYEDSHAFSETNEAAALVAALEAAP